MSTLNIDRDRLNSDLMYRVNFNREFIEFTTEDGAILNAAAPLILPVTMEIVDAVYEHLLLFSNTKEVFLKREEGFEGDLPTVDELTIDHPIMVLRRKFLTMWFAKIMTADFSDPSFWTYLDKVGEMHTGRPAFKHRLNKDPLIVDLNLLSLTLAWIQDVVLTIVLNSPRHELSSSRKLKILRAFNKIIAIQNDLFQRHYVRTDEEAAADLAKWRTKAKQEGTGVEDLGKPSKPKEERQEEEEAKEAVEALKELKV
ncbi:hypothetical protein JCM8097_009486 [Rhodosporidiobolus ruineniae]